jgi:hypothetical protein
MHWFVAVLVILLVVAIKQGVYLYGRNKRRNDTAGFWTKPLFGPRGRRE